MHALQWYSYLLWPPRATVLYCTTVQPNCSLVSVDVQWLTMNIGRMLFQGRYGRGKERSEDLHPLFWRAGDLEDSVWRTGSRFPSAARVMALRALLCCAVVVCHSAAVLRRESNSDSPGRSQRFEVERDSWGLFKVGRKQANRDLHRDWFQQLIASLW